MESSDIEEGDIENDEEDEKEVESKSFMGEKGGLEDEIGSMVSQGKVNGHHGRKESESEWILDVCLGASAGYRGHLPSHLSSPHLSQLAPPLLLSLVKDHSDDNTVRGYFRFFYYLFLLLLF